MNARVAIFAIAVAAVFAGVISSSRAQEPTAAGLWQKLHEQSRQPIAWLLIVERIGVFEGYIAKLFLLGELIVTSCTLCTDDRKDAPPAWLPILRGMKREGLKYENGTVLNPQNGKIYSAMMRLSADNRILAVSALIPGLIVEPDSWRRLPDSAFSQLDPAITKLHEIVPGADKVKVPR